MLDVEITQTSALWFLSGLFGFLWTPLLEKLVASGAFRLDEDSRNQSKLFIEYILLVFFPFLGFFLGAAQLSGAFPVATKAHPGNILFCVALGGFWGSVPYVCMAGWNLAASHFLSKGRASGRAGHAWANLGYEKLKVDRPYAKKVIWCWLCLLILNLGHFFYFRTPFANPFKADLFQNFFIGVYGVEFWLFVSISSRRGFYSRRKESFMSGRMLFCTLTTIVPPIIFVAYLLPVFGRIDSNVAWLKIQNVSELCRNSVLLYLLGSAILFPFSCHQATLLAAKSFRWSQRDAPFRSGLGAQVAEEIRKGNSLFWWRHFGLAILATVLLVYVRQIL